MNPKKVLLIDDMSAFTRLLKLSLERKGCIVREENYSARARATARDFQPDIVFCDVDMPHTDGGEVARQIHSDPDLAHLPIIFLTTLVDPANAGKEIGGFTYLSKPVKLETLLQCIEEYTAAAVVS